MADFDGKNKKRLTHHRGIVISPAFSPDGNKIVYSLIRNNAKRKNVNLRLIDLKTQKNTLVSKKAGINSGAVFTADGKHIILTLAHQGNAELYQMHLASKQLRRLTRHHAPDVDPDIDSKGKLLAFLSGRPENP